VAQGSSTNDEKLDEAIAAALEFAKLKLGQ
jgi:hypothetical protein